MMICSSASFHPARNDSLKVPGSAGAEAPILLQHQPARKAVRTGAVPDERLFHLAPTTDQRISASSRGKMWAFMVGVLAW